MNGILSDREIAELCCADALPMISPFCTDQRGRPSYGLGSFGYDIRLGAKFLVPIGGENVVLDPCSFPTKRFVEIERTVIFDLAPHSNVLAESMETFAIPDDVVGIALGKSSYARCGLIVNATPLEPGWRGVLTIELVNASPDPIRLHVGQGISQVLFFRGDRPQRMYSEKEAGGSYQDQKGVTLPM